MPPKRGRAPKATSSKSTAASKKPAAPRAKRSKAATTTTPKLSDNSAQNDAEILRAFDLWAVPVQDAVDEEDEGADDLDNDEEVIKIADVRRCFSALNLPKPPPDFFDDPSQTYLTRPEFVQLAQTLREIQSPPPPDNDNDNNDNDDDHEDHTTHDDHEASEISHAFSLFTHNRQGSNVRITLADLKRVAMELREEVDEKVLRLMIEEANGEVGGESVGRGVGVGEFEEVMRRAGVFG